MKIEAGQIYKNRIGMSIEILAVKSGSYPVIGWNGVNVVRYTSDGRMYSSGADDDNDLVLERKVWLNLYPTQVVAHVSREVARQSSGIESEGCIEITLEKIGKEWKVRT